MEASGYLVGEYRRLDEVRTLPLSPEFADTKNRLLGTTRLLGSAQLRLTPAVLPATSTLLVGTDWSLGRLTNEYYGVRSGDASAYDAEMARGELDARGEGTRSSAGLFARYELRPTDAVRLGIGTRLDWLHDSFSPRMPATGAVQENTHVAVSPQAGVNLRYLRTDRQEGNLFASVGRSFKAPTMDQLFDQRSIPVPFEPYRVTLSIPRWRLRPMLM